MSTHHGHYGRAEEQHLLLITDHILECIRRAWIGLVRLWPASKLSSEPLANGFYRIQNKRSGAFAALQDPNRYSEMVALLPHMGLTGGDVVGILYRCL